MSRIYIAGLTMPKCCDECRFRHLGLACCTITRKSTSHYNTGKPMDQTRRPDWCPLTEEDEE